MPSDVFGNDLLRRLALIKAFFQRGREFANSRDPISRMLAIHAFDNAVEMMLVAGAIHRKKKVGAKTSFPQLLDLVDPHLKNQLSDLHTRRNGVHHGGDVPTYEDVVKYRGYAEDFLAAECQQISDISFDDLSLADLIAAKSLRARFKNAEKTLGFEQYRDVIAQCDAILTDLFTQASNVFGAAGQLVRHFAGGDEFGRVIDDAYAEQSKYREWYQFAHDVSRAFLQIGQSSTTMQFLDNLRAEFLRFRRLADAIDDIPETELKESAQFTLDFLMQLILKWQSEDLI